MKTTAPPSPPTDAGTIVYELDNGMKVLIREDHFAPVVALQVWVEVGGADERDSEAGIAHVHEHMLFKGTKNRGVGEIATEIESSGGRINAWTSWNETVYHIVVASQQADTALAVLADAMRYSSFDPVELKKELDVVLEEWKRGEDTPSRKIFDSLFENAFQVHPYKRPVIGSKESILALSREGILDFYERFYTPNNMTVVVVGDVDTERMKKDVEKLFGDFSPREIQRPTRLAEPPQTAMRSSTLRMDVKETQLALGFHIPGATHKDAPLLDLLSFIIGGGESSRLYRRLVADDEIVSSIGAFAYTPPDPGLFVVTAALEEKDIDNAYAAAIDELAKVRAKGVTVEELARARTNLESDFIYRNETMQGQARELGYALMVYGDPNWDRVYLKALNEATVEDLQRIAQQYLTRDNLTVVSLLPNDAKGELTSAESLKVAAPLAAEVRAPGAVARSEFPSGPPAMADDAAGDAQSTPPRLVRLDNGVRIVVEEHRGVPVFSIRSATIGGVITENAKNNGISNFVGEMLTRGTTTRSREQFARDIESVAGTIEASSGNNSIGLAANFLTAHEDRGFELFLDGLLHPAFSPVEIEKTRRELLVAIKNRDDNPARVAFNLTNKTVYGDHPYGMTGLGEIESVAKITAEDLRSYYERSLDPERLVVSVVGEIDGNEVVERLRTALGGLKRTQPSFALPPDPAPLDKAQRAIHEIDRKQSHVVVANQSVELDDPDRYPLTVLENILSGQGGRLFYELRDKRSLAYSVSAFFTKGLAPGLFGGYIATDPSNATSALDGLMVEFGRVRNEPVSEAELSRSQRYLIGSRAIGLQTNGAKADEMTLNELYDLGYRSGDEYPKKIAEVKAGDVQRVAKQYLNPEHRAEVFVGPAPESAMSAAR